MFEESIQNFHELPIRDRVNILASISNLGLNSGNVTEEENLIAITREMNKQSDNGKLFMDIYSCHLLRIDWETPPVLIEGYLIKWVSKANDIDLNRVPPFTPNMQGNGLKLYCKERATIHAEYLSTVHTDRDFFTTWDTPEGIAKDISTGRLQAVDTVESDLRNKDVD